jgi:hypothetical protein
MTTTMAQLRRAAADIERATARRDRLIAQARTEGASLRDIGAAANMSHPGVAKVLTRLADSSRLDADDSASEGEPHQP